jgi:hypothetical protein
MTRTVPLSDINVIHTLGPKGTNCEAAAKLWFQNRGVAGEVVLHPTLEAAAEAMGSARDAGLLGCVVYPDLHTLVFSNLERFTLVDQFIMPTLDMVLASATGGPPTVVSTHPAPQRLIPDDLVPGGVQRRLVNSNAQAALDCVQGLSDGCITTIVSAETHGLSIIRNYGPVPMGFTLHVPRTDVEPPPTAGSLGRFARKESADVA